MSAAETKKNIHQRLMQAMQDVGRVAKDKPAGLQYKIVSHDAVNDVCRQPLIDAGITYYPVDIQYEQAGNVTHVLVTVRFVNVDDPSDYFEAKGLGYGQDPGDKGPGKAVSYAVKYVLMKTLSLETGEDADLHASSAQKPAAPQPAAIRRTAPMTPVWVGTNDDGMQVIRTGSNKLFTNTTEEEMEEGKNYMVTVEGDSILTVKITA